MSADLARIAFAHSVARGLDDDPRRLACQYLYDAAGSALFERITRLPEYYLTRAETAILAANARRLRALVPVPTLVELGPGSATKTRLLLDAWTEGGAAASYLPVDVSPDMLAEATAALARDYPTLAVRALAGTYEQIFPQLAAVSPLLLLFLGSSIGNLDVAETDAFFADLAEHLRAGDHVLVGLDVVKEPRVIEAAYNDAAGVTAAFTRNLFVRMNRELGTRLDPDAIEHVAYYRAEHERIEIFARFTEEATLELPEVGGTFRIAAGEMIRTEISRKFHPERVAAAAARFGFRAVETFTDAAGTFALLLLRLERSAAARRPRAAVTALAETRTRTLELVAALDADALCRQHSPLQAPIVWDLGHVARFEAEWIRRAYGAPTQPRTKDDDLFDPIAYPRAVRGGLSLPDPTASIALLREVRRGTLAAFGSTDWTRTDRLRADGYLAAMLAQHEAQHTETILQTIQLIDGLVFAPSRRVPPPAAAVPLAAREVLVPAGPFAMGTDDTTWAYDNERPRHVVELPAFRIGAAPVTNGEFLAFVEDGGYRRRELWTDAGWRWRTANAVERPAQWRCRASGIWHEVAFGEVEPLVVDRPVVHVSWHEADAYARWAGRRLPTEAEWEKAAAWDLVRGVARRYPWGNTPPASLHANLDQRTFAPAAVGAYPAGRSFFGCHQMLGDVWEWTASDFTPYPGFEVFPYPEYSAIHFGRGHKVLRGGSWATEAVAVRNTFRNWDFPERRQIFAGFRCAADV